MPIYEFKCNCGNIVEELFQSISKYENIKNSTFSCPLCGTINKYSNSKIISSPGTILFGEGFSTPSLHNSLGLEKMKKDNKNKTSKG